MASPECSAYFVAAAVKQPLVGAALIPLAMMNRDLQYERIAIVNVCATLGRRADPAGPCGCRGTGCLGDRRQDIRRAGFIF